MKQLIARLILVVAFFAASVHAPAMAHPEPTDHKVVHGSISILDALVDHHEAPASSPESTGENLHHHHCPAAVSARSADVADARIDGEQVLAIHRAAALTSFSQAPPTEPPSA
ncbi:MAG: hypothetical protein ABL912_02955 [Novosphingobium sp.]